MGVRLLVMIVALSGTLVGRCADLVWPKRVAADEGPLRIVSGKLPRDLGRQGNCRVFGLGRGDRGGDRFLMVTSYERDRGNPQVVRIAHAGGVCALSMLRHNGSIAVFRAAEVPEPRGLFVYLTGIIGLTPPEAKLVETFRGAGWHTLVSETSFNFMRRRSVRVDPEKLEATGRALGRDVNDHLADKAYAVEAMLRVLEARLPGVRREPRVLAGGSAGSIAVPTVAARIGKSAAIILIGAGGPVGEVLCESSLEPVSLYRHSRENGQVFRKRLGDAERRRVATAIFAHTPLDPLRLAPSLAGQPLLMMRGELDEMVPTRTNDRLWEALGRPTRWSLPVNHLVLFGMLQFQSATVLDWAEQVLAPAKTRP